MLVLDGAIVLIVDQPVFGPRVDLFVLILLLFSFFGFEQVVAVDLYNILLLGVAHSLCFFVECLGLDVAQCSQDSFYVDLFLETR